jgi:Protein of unknown function (DUF2785)
MHRVTRAVASSSLLALAIAAGGGTTHAQGSTRARDAWVALAKSGFAVPTGATAVDLLVEMNVLLASPDPVLRDEVAYSAAERWILRDGLVDAAGLRRLIALWSANLDDGLGTSGDDRALKRSFSALCLSVAAARHVATPVLEGRDGQLLVDRLLDYLARERDLRGFDPRLGWIHAVAHTADALKFLARGRAWSSQNHRALLAAVRGKLVSIDNVFMWGEAERLAAAIHASVRHQDADPGVLEAWTAQWIDDHTNLWASGPNVNPAAYARVENAKQILRALHALLAMESAPSSAVESARQVVLTTLARMR